MNQIVINRLIGGAVLVFAGAFFVPAILSPEQQTLQRPSLSVSMGNQSNPQHSGRPNVSSGTKKLAVEESAIPHVQALALESTPDSRETERAVVPDENNLSEKEQLIPVALTSIDNSRRQKTESVREDWLQLGSFSSHSNAQNLASELKAARYPVVIRTARVDGAPFTRVLVGPFNDEKKMTSVFKKLQSKGYNPSAYH